jgi:hypothetical protein
MDNTVDRDVLVSRVVDGGASGEDWVALRKLAEREPGIWGELEEVQSMQAAMCAAVDVELTRCASVELPTPGHEVFHQRVRTARSWGGWLIAAAVMLAWSLNLPMQNTRNMASTSSIGPDLGSSYIRVDEPVDALRAYVNRGREAGTVVGLIPDVQVIETRTSPDGTGLEVLLVRRIIERQRVDQVYRWTQDEAGNLIPIKAVVKPTSNEPF